MIRALCYQKREERSKIEILARRNDNSVAALLFGSEQSLLRAFKETISIGAV
jgi:hypothetical protein